MKVEYSKRAISDLRQIAAYHSRAGNPAVAEPIAARIHVRYTSRQAILAELRIVNTAVTLRRIGYCFSAALGGVMRPPPR